MLESLINYYTDGNKAKFALMVGITPQLVSNWLKRETFDAELLYEKCQGVSASWLLTGNGNMLDISNTQNDNKVVISNTDQNKALLNLCKSLVENYQQRDEVMNKLVSMVNNIK